MVGRHRSQRGLAWRASRLFGQDRLSIPAAAIQSREYFLRLACGFIGAVILAHYLAIGANTGPFAMAGATMIFATTLVVAWLVTPNARYWRGAWPGLVGLCIALFVAALPAILAGDRERPDLLAPDLFAFSMIRMGAGMALLIASSWIGYRRGGLRLLIGTVITAGAIDIGVGLLLREIDPRHVWGLSKGINTYRFTGTLLNANASGCIFGVTAILMAGLLRDALLHPKTYGLHALRPIFHTLLIVVAFGACLITGSRTASALTLFALGAVWLVDARGVRTVSRRTMILSAGVGLLLLIAITLWLGSTTTERIGFLANDATQRWAIWSAMLDAARHAPWLGYGAASFDAVKDAAMYDPGQAQLLWYVNSPHNIVIGLILDHGVVFLAATILIALAMWPSFVRVWRDRGHHPVGVSGLVACAMIAGCASVDIALDVPAIMAVFLLLLGLLWGRGLRLPMRLTSGGTSACGEGPGGRKVFQHILHEPGV